MSRHLPPALVLVLPLLLAACQGSHRLLGASGSASDEDAAPPAGPVRLVPGMELPPEETRRVVGTVSSTTARPVRAPRARVRPLAPPPPPPPPPPAGEGGEVGAPTVPTPTPPLVPARVAPPAAPPAARYPPYDLPDRCTPPRTCNPDVLAKPDPLRPYRNAWFGGSPSFLPNVGLAVEAGGVFRRDTRSVWSWELEFTYQFLDDEDVADTADPGVKNYFQLRGGLKVASNPLGRRHWVFRTGYAVFDVSGTPNIVETPGTYWGPYVGVGFETDLNARVTTGPSLTGIVVQDGGHYEVVPQVNWHIIWNF